LRRKYIAAPHAGAHTESRFVQIIKYNLQPRGTTLSQSATSDQTKSMAYLTSARSNCRRRAKVGEITMDNELLNAKIAALEGKRPLARAMKNKPGLYCSPVLRDPAAAPSARAVRPTAPSVPGSRLLDFVPRRGFEACIRLRAHRTTPSSPVVRTPPLRVCVRLRTLPQGRLRQRHRQSPSCSST